MASKPLNTGPLSAPCPGVCHLPNRHLKNTPNPTTYRALVNPRNLRFILLAALMLCVGTVARSQLLPFGDEFLPTFTVTENYTDTVVLGDFGYEQVPDTLLSINARVSMRDVIVADLVADGNSLVINAATNLQLSLDLANAELTELNGYQVYTWNMTTTSPTTGEELIYGTVEMKFNDVELRITLSVRDSPGDFSLYAPQLAGLEDEFEDQPQILSFGVGPYGMEGVQLYLSGKSSVFDKTVGSGDEAQTFYGLAKVNLTGLIDSIPPTVVIDSPRFRSRINERPGTARGHFSDRFGVVRVEVQVTNGDIGVPNDNPWVPTTISLDTWTVTGLDFQAGNVRLRARCIDENGLVSAVHVVDFVFSSTSDLTVTASGDSAGRVTSSFFPTLIYDPALPAPTSVTEHPDGKSLVVTAVPGAGSVFDGWVSDMTLTDKQTASPRLSFEHQPNMHLTAKFLINPFTPVKGRYNGIATGTTSEGNGFLAVTLASDGAFTGSLKAGKILLKLKGKFSNTGRFTKTITVRGTEYTVDLTLNVSGTGTEQITGTIRGGNIDVVIGAGRVVFDRVKNPAPQAGVYNVILPPVPGQPDSYPAGIGFGRVTVSTAGSVRFTGRSGTTPTFNAAARLTGSGTWPFFGALYGKRGSISGVVTFDLANPAHDLNGTLNWFKPANVREIPVYVAGFAGQSTLLGEKFTPPSAGQRLFLDASAGAGKLTVTSLADGALPALQSTLNVTLGVDNLFTLGASTGAVIAPVKLVVKPSTGQVAGSFVEGTTLTKFTGLVLRSKVNRAAGFFRRGGRTGAIEIAAP